MGKKYMITLAGDTSLGEWYIQKSGNKELLQRLESSPESFFKGVKPIISDSDYLVLNLETVLANNPSVNFPDKKYPNWDKKEHLLEELRNLGVTAVNLANNHTMDFGPDVMLQTKKILEDNHIKTFGAGKCLEEAEQPYKITLNGENSTKNIYILGGMNASKRYIGYNFFASEQNAGINSLNLERTQELIKQIRSEDPDSFIVIFPHWQGIDYKQASEKSNICKLYSELIECGANYVIGHGPHIINDIEKNESGTIAYSIGNFIFNSSGRYRKLNVMPYSAIAKLKFEENQDDWSVESRFYPIVTDNKSTNYQAREINELEHEKLLKELSEKNNLKSGKDSFGLYFSAEMNSLEQTSSFNNQGIYNLNINNIIIQKPNDYKNETFSTSYVLATEYAKRLTEAISLTKNNYFKKVVKKKGKYIYSYLPEKNIQKKDYNILRHAGTTYSILETYELMPDDDLLKSAESTITYLISKIKNFDINGNAVSAVVEKDVIKLGGNALAIIMLAKYTQVTKNYEYMELMQRLARWICEAQDKNGEFIIQKQRYSTKEIYIFQSQYYPGEAILSLVRLYQLDGNKDWFNSAELASKYLIKVRDKYTNVNTITHDHWLLYALNELYIEKPQDMYIEHTLLIAKSIIKSQVIGNIENPDWNGAYSIPYIRLESTPTACRSEGLCAAYNLLHDKGYVKELSKIKKAINLGINFQLKNQLLPESVTNYKNKKLCLGAFMRGFNRHDLRIDFTQHNISSLIAYYKILLNLN